MATAQPSRLELDNYDYQLEKIEDTVSMLRGQPYELSSGQIELLQEIGKLARDYPDHETLQSLFARAKLVYEQRLGTRMELTEDMLAYRSREEDVASIIAERAAEHWQGVSDSTKPVGLESLPDPMQTELEEVAGTHVSFVADVEADLFRQNGLNWIGGGSAEYGYVYIDASGRAYTALFEAMRRYQRAVSVLDQGDWHIIAKVVGSHLLVPGEGEGGVGNAYVGWVVEPVAFSVPGVVAAEVSGNPPQATFSAEDELANSLTFTATGVPADASPDDVVRLFVTAIKEKNKELYLACMNPDERTGTSVDYIYDQNIKGFVEHHAHAEPWSVGEIEVIQGGTEAADALEDLFGDGGGADEQEDDGVVKIEQVTVEVRLFDVRGVQTARPRALQLEREDGGQWYIINSFGALAGEDLPRLSSTVAAPPDVLAPLQDYIK
ncbi:Uncharacterized protein SCF082_LOCUS27095, partial [Durusdinium trenchii]